MDKPKSSAPHNSHANAELSIGARSAGSAILRPARALRRDFPWRRTLGGVGIRRTKGRLTALGGLERWGSAGSFLSGSAVGVGRLWEGGKTKKVFR